MKARFKELGGRIEGAVESRAQALELVHHSDPWQVESAFHQAQAAKAEAILREAEDTRAKLMEALDASFRALNEKADRVRQLQKIHNSLRAATRGGS